MKSFSLFLFPGVVVICLAFFAQAIGLDNDPGWGKGRIAILIFGVLIIAYGLFHSLYTDTALSISRKIRSFTLQNLASLLKLFRIYWYTFPILIFVILVYIWFASSGSWTDWHSATNYYANLAMGFKEGELYLPTEPNPKLLNLSNPYDPVIRQGVRVPVDYSLYNGKFYLYWGPVPSIILVMISPFTRGRVGDLYLAFSFISGIFLLQFLLALTIWDRFFRDLPKWILALSILVLGLITPWTYMLVNEPNGRIYEAAISGGQFFLVRGFLVAVIALSRTTPSSLALALTGFLWTLAIGTRLIIALPIGFMTFMVAYRIWKTTRSSSRGLIRKLISLSLPLVLGLIGLGWYNWARFDSVAETGLSYQLNGVNMQSDSLFSPIYIFQNLYNYLLHPPSAMPQFPFLYPKEVSPVIGLLFIVPFTVFALLPIVIILIKTAQNISFKQKEKDSSTDLLEWIIKSLLLAFFSAFCMILLYFWAAMRFLGDFMPTLAMLSVLGFWQGYRLLTQKPVRQKIYATLGIIFASISPIVNILISMAVKQFGSTGI